MISLRSRRQRPASPFSLVSALCGAAAVVACAPPAAEQAEVDPAPTEQAAVDPIEAPTNADAVWVHEASDLEPDPGVRYGVLENGLRYAIMANATPPGTAALRMVYDVGGLDEADDQQGLAHYLEHMAFNGSENVPEGEMIKILERYGLEFGPDTNASTGFERTTYMLDLPNVDDDTLDTAFFLFRETADKLLLDDEAIDRERGIILSEERFRNTFGYRAYVAFARFAYPDARFPYRLPIGQVEVIETAGRDLFVDLYETFYRPDRAMVVMTGDIDVDAIEQRISDTFGDWAPARPAPVEVSMGSVDQDRGLVAGVFVDPDVPTGVSVEWARPASIKPDTAASRAENLPLTIAVSAINRRFTRMARAADAPFLSASVSYDQSFKAFDSESLVVTTEPGAWETGLRAAEQELRRALEHGFTATEIGEQVDSFREGLKLAAEGADTRTTNALASRIAGAYAADRVFTHPTSNLERGGPLLDAITPESAHAALRDRFTAAEPVLFVRLSEAEEGVEDRLLAVWRDSADTPVEPPIDTGALEFAYAPSGAVGAVASRTTVEDLDVVQTRFENGVALNVKTTDFEDNTVRVSIRVDGGFHTVPQDKDGLDIFVGSTFVRGGLEAHSQDDLQTIFAGSSVDSSFGIGADTFGASASVEPDDLRDQLALFAAFLQHPGYRPEAADWWSRVLQTWYDTLDATPQAVAGRDIGRILASGDTRFGVGALADLRARNFDEARAVLEPALTGGAIELTIVGDIDAEEAERIAAETLGALPPRAAAPAPRDPAMNTVVFPSPTEEAITLTHAGEANRAIAAVYWPAFDDADRRAARAATLARAVMDLKMIEAIREEDAATYSPSSILNLSDADVWPGYGYLGASVDVEPSDVEPMFARIGGIAAAMAGGDITADELDRARAPILEDIDESLSRNTYWLSLLSASQTRPDDLERHRTRAAEYGAITLDEVSAAAAQILDPEAAVRIAIVPAAPADGGGEEEPAR